jgi:oxygen-dependent protoporphyrinogen oxidase
MKRVVVIGGGLSGLAAARLLAGAQPVSAAGGEFDDSLSIAAGNAFGGLEILLMEASDRLGGKVRTALGDGPVELGPDQFLKRDPSALNLCHQLGLAGDLVEPAAGAAAVFARGELRQLPGGLVLGVPTDVEALASSGVVSDEALAYAVSDSQRPGTPLSAADVGLGEGDERSVGSLLRPRLGDEIVDHLVDPLLGGINAGSVDHLSLGTTAPQLAAALVGHHDVMAPLAPLSAAGRGAGTLAPSPFFGLIGGLGRISQAVGIELADLGCEVRLDSPVQRLATQGGRYIVTTEVGDTQADAVVLAVPAYVAARLLKDVAPAAAADLESVSYATVAVATLGYAEGVKAAIEGWTGVLIPKPEGALATAVTFLSYKWPWVPGVFVRVSAGRYLDARVTSLYDKELGQRLVSELAAYTGLTAEPQTVTVTRWGQSFPQYGPGHRRKIARCLGALEAHPGIVLAGAALGGIGIPACITSGERAVADLLARLSR